MNSGRMKDKLVGVDIRIGDRITLGDLYDLLPGHFNFDVRVDKIDFFGFSRYDPLIVCDRAPECECNSFKLSELLKIHSRFSSISSARKKIEDWYEDYLTWEKKMNEKRPKIRNMSSANE